MSKEPNKNEMAQIADDHSISFSTMLSQNDLVEALNAINEFSGEGTIYITPRLALACKDIWTLFDMKRNKEWHERVKDEKYG